MHAHRVLIVAVLAAAGLLMDVSPARAQGLLWSLPEEDGTWVKYFGNTKNIQERPESSDGPLELSWLSELTIKSVGQETAMWRGKQTPCRWIEFKLVTGYPSEGGIKPGLYGTRIYKVLVPEEAVLGKLTDANDLPVTYIPIVKGYRKVGDKDPVPVREKVLAVYPMLALFTYYKDFAEVGSDPEDVDLPQLGGTIPARHFKGTETLESPVSRSVNEGHIWLTDQVPFGWAKYSVKLIREEKDSTAPRNDFKKVAEVTVEMQAGEKGTDAQSEIGEVSDTAEPIPADPPAEAPAAEEAPAEEAPAEEAPVEAPAEAEAEPAEAPETEAPEAEAETEPE